MLRAAQTEPRAKYKKFAKSSTSKKSQRQAPEWSKKSFGKPRKSGARLSAATHDKLKSNKGHLCSPTTQNLGTNSQSLQEGHAHDGTNMSGASTQVGGVVEAPGAGVGESPSLSLSSTLGSSPQLFGAVMSDLPSSSFELLARDAQSPE